GSIRRRSTRTPSSTARAHRCGPTCAPAAVSARTTSTTARADRLGGRHAPDHTEPSRRRYAVILTAERSAQGMTFDEYVTYAGTPANLAREAGWWLGPTRHDFSGLLRDRYEGARLTEAQRSAIRWLAGQPNGPARLLVISEEWSSDCRRDVPFLAR